MYLYSGAIKDKDYRMIAKDYYEKFEKTSGKQSKFRNIAISCLQSKKYSLLCETFDKNYNVTQDFLNHNTHFSILVSLMSEVKPIAYAVVSQKNLLNFDHAFQIKDIIIPGEEEYHDLAEGEINIRFNIYNQIVSFIEEIIDKDFYEEGYSIEYDLIDSNDLYKALVFRGYNVDDNIDINEKIATGSLTMNKKVLLKGDNNELHLTRKQSKK